MGAQHTCTPDGRRICARCHQTAVYDLAQARMLFEWVVSVVSGQLGLRLNVGADFTLVDDHHLRRLATEARSTMEGPGGDRPERVIGLFVRRGRRRVMYVLSGLPRILFVQTVAHEWAHAWQGENCPLLRDPLVREGFAEWVAYKTLQAMGAVKKMALIEQGNGLYGEGVRRMLQVEKRHGMHGVLAFCRHAE